MSRPDLSFARDFDAALAWWRAAGVDCEFSDDVTVWLADAAMAGASQHSGVSDAAARAGPSSQASASPALPQKTPLSSFPSPTPIPLRCNLLGDSPPLDLVAFRAWWMAAPGLNTGRLHPRIAPRGPVGADLMVLVPQPEEHDRELLLEGPQGRLLANIMAAMGLDKAGVYLASALPCHTPMADLAAMAATGMDTVTAHHIALVRPRRLLALGTGLGPYLNLVKDEFLREINQSVVNTPVMVSETLDAMIDMPRLKARLWKKWIEWSGSQ